MPTTTRRATSALLPCVSDSIWARSLLACRSRSYSNVAPKCDGTIPSTGYGGGSTTCSNKSLAPNASASSWALFRPCFESSEKSVGARIRRISMVMLSSRRLNPALIVMVNPCVKSIYIRPPWIVCHHQFHDRRDLQGGDVVVPRVRLAWERMRAGKRHQAGGDPWTWATHPSRGLARTLTHSTGFY